MYICRCFEKFTKEQHEEYERKCPRCGSDIFIFKGDEKNA